MEIWKPISFRFGFIECIFTCIYFDVTVKDCKSGLLFWQYSASPCGTSPRGNPFSHVHVYFAGIIRDYLKSVTLKSLVPFSCTLPWAWDTRGTLLTHPQNQAPHVCMRHIVQRHWVNMCLQNYITRGSKGMINVKFPNDFPSPVSCSGSKLDIGDLWSRIPWAKKPRKTGKELFPTILCCCTCFTRKQNGALLFK